MKLVGHGGHHARAGGAEGVTERDRAAVHVEPSGIDRADRGVAAQSRSGERCTLQHSQNAEHLAGEGLDKEPELEVDLFSLMTAFKAIIERAKQRPTTYLPMEQMPLEMRIEQLMVRLSGVEAIGFEELFDDVAQRGDLIVTFLAILELIKVGALAAGQETTYGDIRVVLLRDLDPDDVLGLNDEEIA